LKVGQVKRLFQFPPPGGGGAAYDVASDGQKFLAKMALESKSEALLTLVVNWPSELPKK
jgi:hypothetical protein